MIRWEEGIEKSLVAACRYQRLGNQNVEYTVKSDSTVGKSLESIVCRDVGFEDEDTLSLA